MSEGYHEDGVGVSMKTGRRAGDLASGGDREIGGQMSEVRMLFDIWLCIEIIQNRYY